MDDSKEISKQKFDEIKNKPILGIRRLKRPLKLPKPASQLLHFLDLNHRGVLCYLEGGEQVVIHRLQHNVTLTPVTELNRSWEEEAGYDFCDTITLRQLWDLAEVHEKYSYIWKNCIHTSNKILDWGAERGCCKDNRFSNFKRTKTVEEKQTKHRSFHTLSPLEKRYLSHLFSPDTDIVLLALSPLERNCSGTEKLFNTCFAEQLTSSPDCLNKQEDSVTRSKSTMSDRHRMQLVGIQIYCSGPRRVDDINYRHTSFLPQTYSIELTNITSLRNRIKEIVLSILMLSAYEQCYTRRKDCHTSFQSKTYNADHEQTITEMDRQTLSEKVILTYRQKLQRAQCVTKICILVYSGLRHFRTEDIEYIALFDRTGSLDRVCAESPDRVCAESPDRVCAESVDRICAKSLDRVTIPSDLVDHPSATRTNNIPYALSPNTLPKIIMNPFEPIDIQPSYICPMNYAYTGYQDVTSAFNQGRDLIGHSAHNNQGSSSGGCTLQ